MSVLEEALFISLLGLSGVFITLVVLMLAIQALGRLSRRGGAGPQKSQQQE